MMKKSNKKGFTMVELIIVIALIAILASVLIPTFASLINKANDSAYQQDRTNQMIKDEIEKIDQGIVYMSWEDLEEAIAEALKDQSTDKNLADKIIAIIGDLGKTSTGLTDEQLTKILDAIANKKFSDTQVKVILEGVQSGNTGLTEQQIADILAKLPQVGITEDDLKAAIAAALAGQDNSQTIIDQINSAIEDALKNVPSAEDIADMVKEILDSLKPSEPEVPVVIEVKQSNILSVFSSEYTEYKLVEDVSSDILPITIPEGAVVHLDMNGHNISTTKAVAEFDYFFQKSNATFIQNVSCFCNQGTLVLTGTGTIGGPNGWFGIYNMGTLTLDGPTVHGGTVYFAETGVTVFFGALDNAPGATTTAEGYVYSGTDNGVYSRP